MRLSAPVDTRETGHATENPHGTNLFHGMHGFWSVVSRADWPCPAGDCAGQDQRLIAEIVKIDNRQ